MTDMTITVDRPPFDHVDTTIRHMLRDLYGFVSPDLGTVLAAQIHVAVTDYQDDLLVSLTEGE